VIWFAIVGQWAIGVWREMECVEELVVVGLYGSFVGMDGCMGDRAV